MQIVSVFGGSAPREGEPAYRQAMELGRDLAQAGYAVANGGYIGTMEAVSKGAAQVGGRVIGVTCEQIERFRPIEPNHWLTEEDRSESLRDRLRVLIERGDALLALPGGVGTLAEISLAWSWIQTGEISPRPLILIGSAWEQILQTFFQAADVYVSMQDRTILSFAKDNSSALAQLESWQQLINPVNGP